MRACAYCHYPNGRGNSENASLAGLPYEYFVQTMFDFKNGLRKSADWRKANTNAMAGFAKGMTDDEIMASAEYYSSLKWTPYFKVVETTTVPKTRIVTGMFLALDGDAQEPLGRAHHRSSSEYRTDRSASRRQIGIHFLRSGRQHQERRGLGQDRRRQNGEMRGVSRRE